MVNYTYNINVTTLTINPLNDLENSVTYAVYILASAVKDAAGNLMASDYTFSFTTQLDTAAPTVNANPAGGFYNSPQSVTLTASETATIYYAMDGSNPTTSSTQYTGPINIDSSLILKFMAIDQAGNQSAIYTETYTIDTTAPTVNSTEPVNNATDIPVNKVITITFSEDVQPCSTYDSITVKDADNNPVAVIKNISGNKLTITPSNNLAVRTKYTVIAPGGAVWDQAGNALENNYTFTFTTAKK